MTDILTPAAARAAGVSQRSHRPAQRRAAPTTHRQGTRIVPRQPRHHRAGQLDRRPQPRTRRRTRARTCRCTSTGTPPSTSRPGCGTCSARTRGRGRRRRRRHPGQPGPGLPAGAGARPAAPHRPHHQRHPHPHLGCDGAARAGGARPEDEGRRVHRAEDRSRPHRRDEPLLPHHGRAVVPGLHRVSHREVRPGNRGDVAIVGFGANPATTAALRSASPAAVRLALAAALWTPAPTPGRPRSRPRQTRDTPHLPAPPLIRKAYPP